MGDTDGLRMTESRTAILEELRHDGFHPTADDLYERIRLRLPRVSLATVYRNLEYLSAHGLVRTLKDPDGRRRFDAAPEEHCHVWCVRCGDVRDVRLSPSVCLEELVVDDLGYEIDGYSLSFLGTCPKCRGMQDQSGEKIGGGKDQ